MPYKPHETRQMVLDPNTDGQLIEAYPFLLDIFEGVKFNEEGFDVKSNTADSVLRYISYVYDPFSPMIKQFSEIKVRKDKAGRETNIKPSAVPSPVIVAFLSKIVLSRDWAYIATLENNYEEYLEILNNKVEMEDDNDLIKTVDLKGKLRAQLREMRTEIPALYAEFFSNDEVLIKEHKTLNSPEDYAKALQAKK